MIGQSTSDLFIEKSVKSFFGNFFYHEKKTVKKTKKKRFAKINAELVESASRIPGGAELARELN